MTEITGTGDALNLARSRFDNAKLAYDLARQDAEEAENMRSIAFRAMSSAADDLSRLSRQALLENVTAAACDTITRTTE